MASLKRGESDEPEQVRLSQRRRPDAGRFVVRVDRQSKASYTTAELAYAAGLDIKTRHPVVQVSVYDSEEQTTTDVQPPPDAE